MIPLPHILIIEDNADDYEATERNLRQAHVVNPISWCRNGQDALDFLRYDGAHEDRRTSQPDLILLDLNMSGMDGRKMLEIVKADHALSSIPVIVLTTSSDARDMEACYALGASGYIHKPVDFKGLAGAIRAMNDDWFGIALLPRTQQLRGRNA